MRRKFGVMLAACAMAGASVVSTQTATAETLGGELGSYIVVLEDGVDAASVAQQQVGALGGIVGHVYGSALSGYSAQLTDAARDRLATYPAVDYIQADTPVRATQTMPTGIDRTDAEQSPTAAIDGSDERVNVDVAVIDTGADMDHPDLNVYEEGAKNCSTLSLSPEDENGHGTHVAGTIGALDDASGVVGMAPGARIWPVKVLNALGMGLTSDVICGIDYVAAHSDEIEVANMSLGGSGSDDGNCGEDNNDAQHAALCNAVDAGVTFVVAAGNDSADARETVPAAYDEVITVSALADFDGQPGGRAAPTCREDVDDTFADFSNYGDDIDVIAPGVCIESTSLGGGYETLSGTSMASPHAAGAAALYQANNPAASPEQVKRALQNAGTTDWTFPSEDRDGTQEMLVNVAGF